MDELDYFIENAFSLVTSGYYRIKGSRQKGRSSLLSTVQKSASPVIAEFKRKTPSSPDHNSEAPVNAVLNHFVSSGACALSVLTEPHRFNGSIDDLMEASKVGVPLLMKDFIIDGEQIEAGEIAGADAVLLIQEIFDRSQYNRDLLIEEAHNRGLEVVLEINSVEQYREALSTDADMIGINNRDLRDLTLHKGKTESILRDAGHDRPVIGMSGVTTPEDVVSMLQAGADAVLVGTSIMRDPGLLEKLVEAASFAKRKDMR
ncbi:MAG: indole-3-glycerol-phosphate synthase [Methanomassiliicoccales archaeon]